VLFSLLLIIFEVTIYEIGQFLISTNNIFNILDLISTSHYYSIQYNRLFHHSLHPILSSTRISIWAKRIIHIGRNFNHQISSKFTSSRPDISSKTHEILISWYSSIRFTVQNIRFRAIVGYYTSLFTKIIQIYLISSKSRV